ncbi:MAG TPA: flagellar hook-basal body complex protein FliE [Stellaceae bacterium]|nr:flagellar hook-basal body complex protein FliE [Stellaceae bacterium]
MSAAIPAIPAVPAMDSPMDGITTAMDALASAAGAPVPQIQDPAAPSAGQPSFAEILAQAVGRLDDGVAAANASAQSFASGNGDIPLSDVMISLEEGSLALQTAAAVRDKVLAAYTTIMNMPV